MKKNKILIATQLGILGGEEISILDIIKHLKDQYDFTVFLSERGPFTELLEKNGIHFFIIQLKGHYDFNGFTKIFNILKKNEYDVIHIHSPRMAYYFLLANLFLNRKNIIWTHHVFMGDSFPLRTFRGKLYFWGMKFLMKFAKKNICVSNYIENKLIEHGIKKERLTTIYNGIDIDKKRAVKNEYPKKVRFGLMSRLEKYKGYPVFIETLKKFPTSDREFFIFNTGFLEKEIKELADKRSNVHYMGFVNSKEDIFKEFDILLLLSDFEGFGFITIEAMLYGKPLLARDNILNREILNGYPDIGFIKDFSAISLKEKIIEVSKKENYERLLEYVRNYDLRPFAMEKSISKIRKLYGEISENRN
ncbi:glycosyltransferase family 4 protein [bacterium]|nr:glycosyltransferase family 4 protein [bacterium]